MFQQFQYDFLPTIQGYPCPANYNPADFYIFTLATVPGHETESRAAIKEICDAYETSEEGSKVKQLVEQQLTSAHETKASEFKKPRSPYKANWWTQFTTVLWRSWISMIKDKRGTIVRAVSAVVRTS